MLRYESCWEYHYLNIVQFVLWKILPIIYDAWQNLILQTLIRSFLQHVPIVRNNYSFLLLFFLLIFCHKSISHNLTNEEYALHILSLIWLLIPCSNLLFLTLDVITILHIFAWGYYPIMLCLLPTIIFATFFGDLCTLHRQKPCLF
jgi:hypothetical protein